ncbi:MAG TPA: alginate lyase family protein [Candidatus Eisenbacteria bacterium]
MSNALRKLLAMSPREIAYRSMGALRGALEEPLHAAGLDGARSPAEGEATHEAPFPSPWLEPYEEALVAASIRERASQYTERLLVEADEVLCGQFRILGHRLSYPDRIPWRSDPISGREWPGAFYRRIDIFGGDTGSGDVKFVWELNRHQFLPTLGKAYRLSGDERYAARAVALIDDWIASNPYLRGVNWTSALEVAVRALAWCWTLSLLEGSRALGPAQRGRIRPSLRQHARYLAGHLSYYFSPYNHLVGELTGLQILHASIRPTQKSEGWERRAFRALVEEASRQFHADGGTVEQAIGYHYFTLGFYVQSYLHARRRGVPAPPALEETLCRAFDFALAMTGSDGAVPMIGDADEGKALALEQGSAWDFRPYLALGASLFGRSSWKGAAGDFPADAAWLVGTKGWDRYERLEASPETDRGSELLRSSGYAILRSGTGRGGHTLWFDAGPIAHGVPRNGIASSAHGHADALAFELHMFGEPMLVDPGFFTYNGEEEWHRYFRESDAHNTLVVDGVSQAVYRGRLKWSHGPNVGLETFAGGEEIDFVEGSHDGFARLSPGVRHRRAVLFAKPDYWIIRDDLTGSEEHDITLHFHFAPGVSAALVGPAHVRARSASGPELELILVGAQGSQAILREGGPRPSDGWVAPGYEVRRPAPVVSVRLRRAFPAAICTLLLPRRTEADRSTVRLIDVPIPDRDLIHAIAIERDDMRDLALFSPTAGRLVETEELATDARIAHVRFARNGSLRGGIRVGGTLVRAGGISLDLPDVGGRLGR